MFCERGEVSIIHYKGAVGVNGLKTCYGEF